MSHATPIYALPYPDEADTADVPRDIQALAQRLEVVLPNVGMTSGMGCDWYSANAPPSGFLLCDGSAISRTTYAALFAAIGTAWGGGDGINTFNLPDTRARVLVGLNPAGPNHAAIATNDGTPLAQRRVLHQHTIPSLTATLPNHAHAHALTLPDHAHVFLSRNGASSATNTDFKSGYDQDGTGGGGTQPLPINQTAGGVQSTPAINGAIGNPTSNPSIAFGGTVGVAGTIDCPSFIVVAKVIRT